LQPQIKLPFSVSSIFRIYQHTLLFQYIYTYAALSNGKQIPRQFLLICFRLLIRQMEVCGLSVCWQRKNRSYQFANKLDRLAHLRIQGSVPVTTWFRIKPRKKLDYVLLHSI
jgi:hypothetical protein